MIFKSIAIALALAASPAQAETAQAEPKVETWTDICPDMGETAETVMNSRQEGSTLSSLITILDDLPMHPDLKEYFRVMTFAAFEETRWRTAENKRRAVEEFRERWELSCYKIAAEK